jgi:hypothetical protein
VSVWAELKCLWSTNSLCEYGIEPWISIKVKVLHYHHSKYRLNLHNRVGNVTLLMDKTDMLDAYPVT